MDTLETNEYRNPAQWPEWMADLVLTLVRRYVRRWSGDDAPATLSPEGREETTARVMFDIMTVGEIPEGYTVRHWVFVHCRRWRIRNWMGDCELDTDRKRAERSGLTGWGAPFSGASADAKTPTPDAILSAIENATGELILSALAVETRQATGKGTRIPGGLRAVSDRQRKARRRAVKGRCRIVVVCEIESRAADRTYIRFRRIRLVTTRHVGTIPSREIGKALLRGGMEDAPAILRPRDNRGRFVRQSPAIEPLPAIAGDGTVSRPWDGTEYYNAGGFMLRHWTR